MPNWIASAHGAQGTQNLASVTIPAGVELYFFAPIGTCISNKDAWPIYYKLIATVPEEATVQQMAVLPVKVQGDSVPNLVLYGTNDFPSGIIAVGSGKNNIHYPLQEGQQMNLYDLLYKHKYQGKIYWLACTA